MGHTDDVRPGGGDGRASVTIHADGWCGGRVGVGPDAESALRDLAAEPADQPVVPSTWRR
jgi:hypothetical protein